jgi:pimeloyl-ACP methyl ester carboxylesterase
MHLPIPHRPDKVAFVPTPFEPMRIPQLALAADFRLDPQSDVTVHRHRTETGDANVRYTVFEPEDAEPETAVHIRNGFFGAEPMYWGLAKALAIQGRRTVVTEVVHRRGGRFAWASDVLDIQARAGAAVMQDVRRKYGNEKADVIAHSMGGLTTTILAHSNPEMIRSISYTGAAGVDGRHEFAHRLRCTMNVLQDEVLPSLASIRADYDPARSMLLDAGAQLLHPLRRAQEAMATAHADDRDAIQTLRDTTGIRIGAVLLEHDAYFRPAEVLHASHGLYDEIAYVPGALHIDPVASPHRHAAVQLIMLSSLNQAPGLRLVR